MGGHFDLDIITVNQIFEMIKLENLKEFEVFFRILVVKRVIAKPSLTLEHINQSAYGAVLITVEVKLM